MNRKKSMERKLVCETIHNVSVGKMGQAILKKNPYETRVLIDKLENIEIHKRRWKNDFCGKLYDTRQEFKRTQDMETLAFIQLMSGSREEKTSFKPETTISRRVSTTRKSYGRIYKQAGKDSEAAITNDQDPSQKASKKEKPSVSILGKKKTLATEIKMYLNDKLLSPIKEDSCKVAQERGRRSVTPDFMMSFTRHSFSVCPNQSCRTASGDVTCE